MSPFENDTVNIFIPAVPSVDKARLCLNLFAHKRVFPHPNPPPMGIKSIQVALYAYPQGVIDNTAKRSKLKDKVFSVLYIAT
jgi:hypothetical protein